VAEWYKNFLARCGISVMNRNSLFDRELFIVRYDEHAYASVIYRHLEHRNKTAI
jgi:hypothetical protein